MKKILLIGLAFACLILPKKSKAEVQSTLSGDSAQYRYWCADSTGSSRACDSAWWYLTRITPATGVEVFVDSGRTTSPAAVFGGAFLRYRISDAQFTALTAGRYVLDILAWGGTFGSQKLTTPHSHYFSVGLDSSTITAPAFTDASLTKIKFHSGFYNLVADTVDNHYVLTSPNDTIRFVRRADTLAFILPAEKSLLADTIDNHYVLTNPNDTVRFVRRADTAFVPPPEWQEARDTALNLGNPEPGNLVSNPSFERTEAGSLVGWRSLTGGNVAQSVLAAKSGHWGLLLRGDGSDTGRVNSDSIGLTVGQRIVFGGFMRKDAGGSAQSIEFRNGDAVGNIIASVDNTTNNKWQSAFGEFKIATSGFYHLRLRSHSTSATDSGLFDDVFLRIASSPLATDTVGRAIALTLADSLNKSVTVDQVRPPERSRLADTVDNHYVLTSPNDTIRFVRRTDTLAFILPAEKSLLADTIDNHYVLTNPNDTIRFVRRTDTLAYMLPSGSDLLADNILVRRRGTVGAGSTQSKIISTSFAGFTDDEFANNMIVFMTSGGGGTKYHTAYITRLHNTGDSASIRPILPVVPTAGDSFAVIGILGKTVTTDTTQGQGAVATVDTAAIARAVWDNDIVTLLNRTATVGATASAGAWVCSLLVIDSAASTPVQGVLLWITTSGAVTSPTLVTSSAGKVANNLDNGTHAAHLFSAGLRLATNSDTVINISGANFWDTITTVSTQPSAPAIAGLTRVFGNIRDLGQDSNIVGIQVFATTVKSGLRCCDSDTNNFWIAGRYTKEATWVTSGCWQIDLVPSASWNPDADYKFVIKVPGVGEFTKVVTVPASPAVWRMSWSW